MSVRFIRIGAGAWLLPLAASLGCIDSNKMPTVPSAVDDVFASVVATPVATTLAVGGTQTLSPVATNLAGQTITPASGVSVKYASSDPSTVAVSGDGVITGVAATTTAKTVTTTMTAGGITKTTTTYVTVTPTSAALGSVSAQIAAPDSALLGAQGTGASQTKVLRPVAKTALGATIPNVTFYFESLTPEIATVTANTGVVTGVMPGTAKIGVRTTAYGVTKGDTVAITITRPVAATITFGLARTLDIPTVTVQRNATVVWNNSSGNAGIPAAPLDITFDNGGTSVGTGTATGNIPAFTTGTQSRKFTVPGTYTYKSTNNPGVTGTVIVE